MAYKFEDKFVHFRYDASLKGKEVFYADNIGQLEDDVAEGKNYRLLIGAGEDRHYPFQIKGSKDGIDTNWQFVYYDPNYEAKLAYEEGKQIQYRAKDTGNWCDWDNSLGKCPFHEDIEHRIKPEEDDDEKEVLKWTDLNVGDIIEFCSSEEHRKAIITEIDFKDGWGKHIRAGSRWVSDTDLINWRKVKND